ncbi:hypothetical protein JCM11641_002830 [Rhodosporidiobolus odoratus]
MAYLTPPHSSPESLGHSSASEEAAALIASSSSLPRRPSNLALPTAKRPRSSLANRPALPTTNSSSYLARTAQHAWPPSSSGPAEPSQLEAQPSALEHSAAWSASALTGVPTTHAVQTYCPTPELSPDGLAAAPATRTASRPSASSLLGASLAGSGSTFVRRDDLTAKAVAKAEATCAAQEQQEQGVRLATASQGTVSDKDRFVNGLVGASVLAIESIWGSSTLSSLTQQPAAGVLPLQWFVKEVLRRSRTSCSTLQLALYYLHNSRRKIRQKVADAASSRRHLEAELRAVKQQADAAKSASSPYSAGAASYPSPPHSPQDVSATTASVAAVASLSGRFAELLEEQNSPVLCGRRMFLAALISASKYLQDRNYSNRAWAKISGLTVTEINGNEREFLKLVGFQLHLRAEDFKKWTDRLHTLTSTASASSSPLPTAQPSPSLLARHGLSRSSSEYVPAATSAPLSTTRPTTAPTAVQRLALSRGATVPILSSSLTTREKGFPIARPVQTVSPATVSPTSSSSSSEGEEGHLSALRLPHSYGRKTRGLPMRRTGVLSMEVESVGAGEGRSFVPASWAAGAGAGGVSIDGLGGLGGGVLRNEAVRAH